MLLFRKSSLWGCYKPRHVTKRDMFLFINSKILHHTLTDNLIGQPYWTTLLDSLIVQPYCTTLLYSLIVQPYCTALLNNLIVQPYCTTLLYNLIVQAYCAARLYSLIERRYWTALLYSLIEQPYDTAYCTALLNNLISYKWPNMYLQYSENIFKTSCNRIWTLVYWPLTGLNKCYFW
mgnify:CR=1 FL=1